MIAETTAPRKALTATPASRSVAIEKRPPTAAMPYTKNDAAIAPTNAKVGSARKNSPVSPVAIATTAPTAPPAETPMMPGSAIGLRNRPCIVAPATPSAIPTVAPTTIRGSLICSMTSCSVRPKSARSRPTYDSRIETTRIAGISTGPRFSETSATASITTSSADEPTANRVETPRLPIPPQRRDACRPQQKRPPRLSAGGHRFALSGTQCPTTEGPSLRRRAVTFRSGRSPGSRADLHQPHPSHRIIDSGLRPQIPLTVALPRRILTAFPILP